MQLEGDATQQLAAKVSGAHLRDAGSDLGFLQRTQVCAQLTNELIEQRLQLIDRHVKLFCHFVDGLLLKPDADEDCTLHCRDAAFNWQPAGKKLPRHHRQQIGNDMMINHIACVRLKPPQIVGIVL